MLFVVATVLPPLFRIGGLWPELGTPLYLPLYILTTGTIAHFGIAATATPTVAPTRSTPNSSGTRSGAFPPTASPPSGGWIGHPPFEHDRPGPG